LVPSAASARNEGLEGYVALDLECPDPIYLNADVPTLQVGGQVINFFSKHRNPPIASTTLLQQMGDACRAAAKVYSGVLRPLLAGDHHQSRLRREVYQLHFGADECVVGDELLFLPERESEVANGHMRDP
jgi:hypothetical protein